MAKRTRSSRIRIQTWARVRDISFLVLKEEIQFPSILERKSEVLANALDREEFISGFADVSFDSQRSWNEFVRTGLDHLAKYLQFIRDLDSVTAFFGNDVAYA